MTDQEEQRSHQKCRPTNEVQAWAEFSAKLMLENNKARVRED